MIAFQIDIRFGGSDAYEDEDYYYGDYYDSDDLPSFALLDATDKKCPGSLEVCCRNPDWRPTTTPAPEEEEETTTPCEMDPR